MTETPELKHLILHTERFVLPDQIADWAENVRSQIEYYAIYGRDVADSQADYVNQRYAGVLANYVRKVAILAPLARLGSLVFLPSREDLIIDDGPLSFYGRHLGHSDSDLIAVNNDLVDALALDDPYLASVVVNKLKIVADWEYEVHRYDKVMDLKAAAAYVADEAKYYPDYRAQLARVMDAAYGGTASPNDVRDAVQLNKLCGDIHAMPVVSSRLVRKHLLNSAAVIVDGGRADVMKSRSALEAAVAYRVPSLAGVSFADLVRLRLNEDIYHDVKH